MDIEKIKNKKMKIVKGIIVLIFFFFLAIGFTFFQHYQDCGQVCTEKIFKDQLREKLFFKGEFIDNLFFADLKENKIDEIVVLKVAEQQQFITDFPTPEKPKIFQGVRGIYEPKPEPTIPMKGAKPVK